MHRLLPMVAGFLTFGISSPLPAQLRPIVGYGGAEAARLHLSPMSATSPTLPTVPVPSPHLPTRAIGAGAPASPGVTTQATVLSALLPGAGQFRLGQSRAWFYVALEAIGWVGYVDRRGAAGDFRDRYRDFAWSEARLQSNGRVDGDFDYYETLTSWTRSGVFDQDPATAGVQPERDGTTFNGSIWILASGLFLGGDPDLPVDDPRYDRAVDFYRERAYGTAFLWDWTGTGSAQDDFAGLIAASDDRYRQATNVLGLIIANHVVSAVDAYLSSRVDGVTARAGFATGRGGLVWSASLHIATPNGGAAR